MLDARRTGFGFLALGIACTLLVYFPGLEGAFFFDDAPNISRNPSVRLSDLSLESLRLAWSGGLAGPFGRPVSQITFALNHYFNGLSPWAFKLTNLLIHCTNGLLVYILAARLFDEAKAGLEHKNSRLWAAAVGCLWLLHPIQLTSVLYVVQRMTSLSAFFVLAALLLHVAARHAGRDWQAKVILLVIAWGVCWPLGVLSKESAILFPGFVAVYELTLRRIANKGLDAFGKICLWGSLASVIALVFYLLSPLSESMLSGYEIRSFTLTERLLTETRVLWAYLGWIAVPSLDTLALFHDDFTLSRSILKPWTTLAAIGGLFGVLLFAVIVRDRSPMITFGIAWFLVGHSLESTFIPLELIHEHRNYLPSLGVYCVFVDAISRLAARSGAKRTLAITMIIGATTYAGFVTAMRADMYSNELRRTQIESQAHPSSARSNYEAGRSLAALAEHGNNLIATVLSKKHFEMATAADPDYKMGLIGQIILSCGVTETPEVAALDELGRRFRNRLILQEDTSILTAIVEMANAGELCLSREQIDGLFNAFFANETASSFMKMTMYSLYADYLWLNQKDLQASRDALHNALNLAPQNPSLRLKWAQLEFIGGNHQTAKKLLLELRDAPLDKGERETLRNLLAVLAG